MNGKQQAQQAERIKKRYAKTVKSSGVGPGTIGSVKNDFRNIIYTPTTSLIHCN